MKSVGIVSFKKFTPYTAVHVSNTTRYLIDIICYHLKQQLQKQQEPFSCLSAGLQPLPLASVTPVFHVNSFS